VEKKPIVSEEVRVGKRDTQDTERVSDDVRHEELHVDKEGDAEVETDETRRGKRKKPAA
jgi:stress response protein YsnF